MNKLSMDELNRLSVEEYHKADKLPLTIVLDNVRSQNNIGSIFRTADAFRIERICLCGICSTPPHRDIHKTALGAEDAVSWSYHESTAECIKTLRGEGYKVYAIEQVHGSLMLDGEALRQRLHEDCGHGMAIVFGNEVEGVQEEAIELCDASIEIPQYGTKHSLNVSCSAAIVMWQLQCHLRGNQPHETDNLNKK